MGPGVSPGPWPPQIFSYTVGNNVPPACGGLGTGQRTRICRCFVLWPDNAHCRLVSFAGGRCGPTARGWNVSVAFRPLVPVGSTPRGASTSGLSTTCSAWGLQELEGSTECLSLESGFPLRCFQRLSDPNVAATGRAHWREQPVQTRGTSDPGPLVLWDRPPQQISSARTTDRDRTVSRRSEPSSRAALIGEQPNPWDLLQPQDATSRHRGAKPSRRYGLLGMISLLSPGYLLSVERCRVRTPAPDH